MAYSIPRYIAAAAVDDPELRFEWDDTKASEHFVYEPEKVLEKLTPVSLRAKIAAAIGIYEWIVWRFRSVSDDPTPFHLAEAAWCANIHRGYMKYCQLSRRKWLGPVRGPLWCAVTWLVPMIFFSDDDPEESESGLTYLSSLAVHVLPKPAVFEDWLDACMDRLVAFYSVPPEDPFQDLFGEKEEERRGPLVPREALEPDFDYRPEMAEELIFKYLRGIDYKQNPFLRSPEEIIQEGFVDIQYPP